MVVRMVVVAGSVVQRSSRRDGSSRRISVYLSSVVSAVAGGLVITSWK